MTSKTHARTDKENSHYEILYYLHRALFNISQITHQQMHYIFTFYALTPTYVSAFTRPSSGGL
jgi:ABC-type long-subunit fatty acid transport system fused permease/ATPase subunit